MGSVANNDAVSSGQVPLSPSNVDEFRKFAHQMVDFVADYHLQIESFPVRSQVEPGYLKHLLPDSAPEDPEGLEDVLSDVRSKIFPGITHWQSPNFFAYYPANCSTPGFLGDMLSSGLGVMGFSWISSPAATELETIVLDWLGKLLQLPKEFLSTGTGGGIIPGTGGGVIQGTASDAVLVVMLAARQVFVDRLTKQGLSEAEAFGKLVAYTSDQAHSCVQKACQIAGLSGSLRVLPTDATTNFALSPASVSKAVAEDLDNGLVPFFLCGTVGTTSSSAVDPISELGNIALENGMWFHVDAAYAGSACICPEFQPHLEGIEKADSFCMNPHKWLLTSFDCSTLWVKDTRPLLLALSTSPEYLRNKASDEQLVVDYKDLQVSLGRRFRSLKLWFVLRMYGASGLRSHIRNHVAVAKQFESNVQSDDRFEVVTPRNFSLVCFRLKPLTEDTDNGKTLNSKLMEAINSSGKLFLTHTILAGTYALRMAVGAAPTQQRHLDDAWSTIKSEAERLLAEEAEEAEGHTGEHKAAL